MFANFYFKIVNYDYINKFNNFYINKLKKFKKVYILFKCFNFKNLLTKVFLLKFIFNKNTKILIKVCNIFTISKILINQTLLEKIYGFILLKINKLKLIMYLKKIYKIIDLKFINFIQIIPIFFKFTKKEYNFFSKNLFFKK